MNHPPDLTLYYDGRCPICTTEMARLMAWDGARRLAFVDITRRGFDPAPLGVDMAALNRALHARTGAGAILTGIDSILAAYTLAGRGWLVWPLRLRWLRPVLAPGYHWFARHRQRISTLLGYRQPSPCHGGACRTRQEAP